MRGSVKLEGIHHVTCITGNAPANVEFYADTLGLRLVKKTVNQDDPTVYHLFYADEKGSAGADITFFEYPGAPRGRAGDGMVHRIVFRVGVRGGARLLGRASSRREALRLHAHPRPRRARAGARGRRIGRRAADRRASADPAGARAARLRRRARVLVGLRPQRHVPLGARVHAGLGVARREARRLLRLRRGARGARPPGRRHRPPRRLGLEDGGARGVARQGARDRRSADAGDRPLLLPLDLLPGAERRAVRDRDARAGVHGRRAARDARRASVAAARLRAAAARAGEDG